MTAPRNRLTGSARSVVREIDQELNRLHKYEQALAAERELLLSARAALAGSDGKGPAPARRVSQGEIAAHLAEHPGCWPAEVANALQAPTANVSTHLYRGRYRFYELRKDGWYLRSQRGSDA
jgi:hypothetical protein